MRWFDRLVAKHLRHPTGIFGRRVARRMNAANLKIYELALANLEIAADDSLLDIGFGGGPAFQRLCALVPQGEVTGVDSSATMLRMAAASFPDLIAAGRLALHPGWFDRLPFQANRFDKIFSINTIYFWDDPALVLGEIARVLKPNGCFAIGFRTPDAAQRAHWQAYGFVYRSQDEVRAQCQAAGFVNISFVEQAGAIMNFACALARKPARHIA
ncbi:MAG: class I SAM-dependent methyltransferase [Proteobacteria bacterium]|nr:class I SAM-dependent methyltransferase [Pseudomonadota bacterium]